MNDFCDESTNRWWIVVTEKGPKVQTMGMSVGPFLWAEWKYMKYLLLIINEKDSIFVSCYFFK